MQGSYKPLAVPLGRVPPPKAEKAEQLTPAPSGIVEAAGGEGAGTRFPRTPGHHHAGPVKRCRGLGWQVRGPGHLAGQPRTHPLHSSKR